MVTNKTYRTHEQPLDEMIEESVMLSAVQGTVRHSLPEEQASAWTAERDEGARPLIGMPLPVQQGEHGLILLGDAIGAWAVERLDARLLLLPLWPFPPHRHRYQSLWPLIQSIDGLFLPAGLQGPDWYTLWHASYRTPDRTPGQSADQPDDQPSSELAGWPLCWQLALAQLATVIGMPLLAIGDGAEQWNSALGGLRGDRSAPALAPVTPDDWERRQIRVRARSTLAALLQPALAQQQGQVSPWELAFVPAQKVERLAPGLRCCAQTETGSIVAFERGDGCFGIGMLGRLDWGLDQIYSATLFEAFVQACRTFRRARQQQATWEAARDAICAAVTERVAQGQPLIAGRERALSSSPAPPSASDAPPEPATSAVSTVSAVSAVPASGPPSVRVRHRLPLSLREERIRTRREHLLRARSARLAGRPARQPQRAPQDMLPRQQESREGEERRR